MKRGGYEGVIFNFSITASMDVHHQKPEGVSSVKLAYLYFKLEETGAALREVFFRNFAAWSRSLHTLR